MVPVFGFIIAAWSTIFMEHWKQIQSKSAAEWGMSEFEQTEMIRPQYHGESISSFIDGKPMIHFPRQKAAFRARAATAAVFSFIILVIGIVAGIYILKTDLTPSLGQYASMVVSAVNACQITIMKFVFTVFVQRLNGKLFWNSVYDY